MATMKRTWVVCVAASLMAALSGCGGRQNLLLPPDGTDAGGVATATATLGLVDFTQAPAELAMTCDHGVGTLAFDNPCLVGQNLSGGGIGIHEVECTLAASGHPITWTFLLPLAQVIASPAKPLAFPLPPGAPLGTLIDVGGQGASVSGFADAITFSRVDPTNRAFVARLKGTMTWKRQSGATFSCTIDSPFWGAPGNFA
jgi:hypothetical protein